MCRGCQKILRYNINVGTSLKAWCVCIAHYKISQILMKLERANRHGVWCVAHGSPLQVDPEPKSVFY